MSPYAYAVGPSRPYCQARSSNLFSGMTTTNNYTTFPEGIKTQEEFTDWCDYENSEFRAEQNHKECWGDVDKLKSMFPGNEVYLVSINSGRDHDRPLPCRKESEEARRYTFAFDYAVTGISDDDLAWMWYYIMRYRNEQIDDPRTDIPWNTRVSIWLVRVGIIIEKYPHVQSHFS